MSINKLVKLLHLVELFELIYRCLMRLNSLMGVPDSVKSVPV